MRTDARAAERQSARLEAFDALFNKRDYVAAERYWCTRLHPTQRPH